MDTSDHFSLSALFQQLGLPFEDEAIVEFIGQHRLSTDDKLPEAPFWTAAQAAFLQEAIDDDSDWAEAVDHLDAELRR